MSLTVWYMLDERMTVFTLNPRLNNLKWGSCAVRNAQFTLLCLPANQ